MAPQEKSEFAEKAGRRPSFSEAFRFWLKLGFISFGGPAGQIAIMQTELVEKKRWISQSRFLHALNYCMLLPGPEAQQLAIYHRCLLHKTWGGIVAALCLSFPLCLCSGRSASRIGLGNIPWIAAAFLRTEASRHGDRRRAVIRIGRKALRNPIMWCVAAVAFIGIFWPKSRSR